MDRTTGFSVLVWSDATQSATQVLGSNLTRQEAESGVQAFRSRPHAPQLDVLTVPPALVEEMAAGLINNELGDLRKQLATANRRSSAATEPQPDGLSGGELAKAMAEG